MTLQEAHDEFIAEKKRQRKAPKTIRNYKDFLRPMLVFLGRDLSISDLSVRHINDYRTYQSERPIAQSTYNTYMRHFKAFLHWLVDEYGIDINPRKVNVPKDEKKCPDIYSPEQTRLLFETITAENEWLTVCNRAMVALMLDSGPRQSEVSSILSSDIDFKNGLVKVVGKGQKERMIPLGRFSAHYMQEYARLCPYQNKPYFFVGRRGEAVTSDSLKHVLTKISKKLPFRVSCHLLRHNFATNWCIDQYDHYRQVDIYSLKAIMGHSDIKTTERYLHYAMSMIAAKNSLSHLDMLFCDENLRITSKPNELGELDRPELMSLTP